MTEAQRKKIAELADSYAQKSAFRREMELLTAEAKNAEIRAKNDLDRFLYDSAQADSKIEGHLK